MFLTSYIGRVYAAFCQSVFFLLQINSDSGEIQLSGACLPRKAKLLPNACDSSSSEFVYLPKEVLNGSLYVSSSDIYCFALMCLELKSSSSGRVFEQERLLTMVQFRSQDTTSILERHLERSLYQREFKVLLQKCLNINASLRPSALEIWTEQNRMMEKMTTKASHRSSAVNGTVAPRHLWSNYRARHNIKS